MGVRTDPRLTVEFLTEQCVRLRRTSKQVAEQLGLRPHQVKSARQKYGIEGFRRGRKRKYDVGEYDGVIALERFQVGKPWFFRCVCHCGRQFVARVTHIGMGKTRSCGCLQPAEARERLWGGYGEISGSYWGSVRRGARDRELAFDVSIEEAWAVFQAQGRRCALSGGTLEFGTEQTASLDRVDSRLGYVPGNVQWTHKDINRMKGNLPDPDFVAWCVKVAEHCRALHAATVGAG